MGHQFQMWASACSSVFQLVGNQSSRWPLGPTGSTPVQGVAVLLGSSSPSPITLAPGHNGLRPRTLVPKFAEPREQTVRCRRSGAEWARHWEEFPGGLDAELISIPFATGTRPLCLGEISVIYFIYWWEDLYSTQSPSSPAG